MDSQIKEISTETELPVPSRKAFPYKSPVFLFIFVIIALSVAFIAGGYFLGAKEEKKAEVKHISPSPSITVNPTSNWKTYLGSDFSFQYPSQLSVANESENETIWTSEYADTTMYLKSQNKPFIQPSIGKTLIGYNLIPQSFEENKSILIDGVEAKSYIILCGTDCHFHIIYFQNKNKYYELGKHIAGAGLEENFDQILSTFTFTK